MRRNTLWAYALLCTLLIASGALALMWPLSGTATYGCACFCGVLAVFLQICDLRRLGAARGGVAEHGLMFVCAQLLMSLTEMALADIMPPALAVSANVTLGILMALYCVRAEAGQPGSAYRAVPDAAQLRAMTASMLALCGDPALRDMLTRIEAGLSAAERAPSHSAARRNDALLRALTGVRRAIYYGDADSAKRLCAKLLGSM